MQEDKTKIATRWHSSTRYKNGLKWVQITLQNIPVEQTSSSLSYVSFPFTPSECGLGGGSTSNVHCDIVSWERKCAVCVCVRTTGLSLHHLGSCCRGKCWLLITKHSSFSICWLHTSQSKPKSHRALGPWFASGYKNLTEEKAPEVKRAIPKKGRQLQRVS